MGKLSRRSTRRASRHSAAPPRKRSTRLAAIALGVGVAMVLVFALVFSIAFGTRQVAEHADALHNADEALRAATVARAQAGLAAHLAALEREFGFEAADAITTSTDEANLALSDLQAGLTELDELTTGLDDELVASRDQFVATVGGILSLLSEGDSLGAQEAATALDADFRSLVDSVVIERDFQASAVATANAAMGRIGDVVRFLVAFLVPTAVILLYRELSKRQQKQTELEVRLEAEQELGQARDEFVANASHELRTPLTSIFGLAHILEEDETVVANETSREMVAMIISETHDLSRMVDDLLTTARLDAGAMHYQFENLPILDEVHEVVDPMERAGLGVGIDISPALVRSDRLRFRQVLRNLLSNAGKYGGDDVRVVGRVVSGWYEVIVADDGEGIPKELEERLFQRFLHKGDLPLVLGSVGLGLSIVRALAEGMGGAVWYERERGWTKFVLRVPLAKAPKESRFKEPDLHRQRRGLESAGGTEQALPAQPPQAAPAAPAPAPAPAIQAAPAPAQTAAEQLRSLDPGPA